MKEVLRIRERKKAKEGREKERVICTHDKMDEGTEGEGRRDGYSIEVVQCTLPPPSIL